MFLFFLIALCIQSWFQLLVCLVFLGRETAEGHLYVLMNSFISSGSTTISLWKSNRAWKRTTPRNARSCLIGADRICPPAPGCPPSGPAWLRIRNSDHIKPKPRLFSLGFVFRCRPDLNRWTTVLQTAPLDHLGTAPLAPSQCMTNVTKNHPQCKYHAIVMWLLGYLLTSSY